MKKHGLTILICLALIFIFISESYPDTEAGQILTVRKKVYLIRGKQRSYAEPQMQLLLKDAVETDKKSRTKLFFKDDSILNLGELSRVEVEEYLYSPEKKRSKSIYRLIDGSLQVVVGRSDLEIHTPTAVAAARGTKFIMWVEGRDDSAKSCAMVSEGEVLMKSNKKDIKGMVTVKKGTMSCVLIDMPPEPVTPVTPKALKRFTDNTMVVGTATDYMREGMPERFPALTLEGSMREMKGMEQPPVSQEPVEALTPVTIDIIFQ